MIDAARQGNGAVNLKPLERSGFLTAVIDEKDRRARRLLLTDAGREVLAVVVPIWELTHARVENELGWDAAIRIRTDLNELGKSTVNRK